MASLNSLNRRSGLVALTLSLSVFLAACGTAKTPAPVKTPEPQTQAAAPATAPAPAPAPAPAKPKDVKKLKLANAVTPPNMIHMPMYIALDRGFFKEEAIEAEIISLEGGVGTARALTAKAVDVASTSADPLIASAAAGGEIIAVYTYAPRVTNAMIGGAKVKALADLKGKIIGIQEKNGFADVVSRLVLSKAGVKENEVTFLSTSTAGRLPALLAGQVDTGILHIEQVYKAMEENPSLNFVSRLWEADPLWWYSAYAMNKETIKNDPDVAERFVRAIIKSTRWMYKPENKAQVVESYLKFNKGFTKELADKTYDDIVKAKQWPMNEGVSREIVEHTVKAQMELGILKTDKAPTYEQLYDRTFIDKVLKELGKDGDAL